MTSFNYPLLTLFFDIDKIACTFLDEVYRLYPEFKNEFNKKSWTLEREVDKKIFHVIAVADVVQIIS